MTNDNATACEGFAVGASTAIADSGLWHCDWTIQKWDEEQTREALRLLDGIEPTAEDFAELGIAPYETAKVHGNLLTTAGLGRIATLVNLGTGNKIDSTTARVGAGDGAGTAAIGDTDLSAAAGS